MANGDNLLIKERKKAKRYTTIALVCSIAWISVVILFPLYFHNIFELPPRMQITGYWGIDAKLGEAGDYLTGWLTPMALFWFVIAVFLQRSEINAQFQEFRRMAEANRDQALHLKKANKVAAQQLFVDVVKKTQETKLFYFKRLYAIAKKIENPHHYQDISSHEMPDHFTLYNFIRSSKEILQNHWAAGLSPQMSKSPDEKLAIETIGELLGIYKSLEEFAKEAEMEAFLIHRGNEVERDFFGWWSDCGSSMVAE